MKNETGRPPDRPAANPITAPSIAPRLVIVLGLEASPKVHEEAEHEGDSRRLAFWVKSQPAILKLVVDALELGPRKAA